MLLDNFIKEQSKIAEKYLYKWVERNWDDKISVALSMFDGKRGNQGKCGYKSVFDLLLAAAIQEEITTINGKKPNIEDIKSAIKNHRKKLGLVKAKTSVVEPVAVQSVNPLVIEKTPLVEAPASLGSSSIKPFAPIKSAKTLQATNTPSLTLPPATDSFNFNIYRRTLIIEKQNGFNVGFTENDTTFINKVLKPRYEENRLLLSASLWKCIENGKFSSIQSSEIFLEVLEYFKEKVESLNGQSLIV